MRSRLRGAGDEHPPFDPHHHFPAFIVGATLSVCALLVLFSVCGCAHHPKGKTADLIQYSAVRGELGKITYTMRDGSTKTVSVPWDCTWEFRAGAFSASTTAFKIQALFGVSCWQSSEGIRGSPWAGIRYLHVANVGLDAGFDDRSFTVGIDWLHHGIAIGPSIHYPYDLGRSRAGMKASILF